MLNIVGSVRCEKETDFRVAWLPSSQNATSFGVGTTQDSTTGTKEVQTQVTAVTDFSLLAQKHENPLIFSAGAPLLQFWHHEVTDCSAKTSVPKV